MSGTPNRTFDRRMETAMAILLRGGVLLASLFVLIGAALYLAHHAGAQTDYRDFAPRSIAWPGFLSLLAHADGVALMQLGLFLLVATPIARVLLGAVAFFVERDKLYIVISLFILCVLVYGIGWGR